MAEIILCSKCRRKLQVPDQYLGQTVQCPECGHMFVASATAVSAVPAPPPSAPHSAEPARPAQPRRYDDEDAYPARRRRRFDEDDDDDFDGVPRIRHDFAPHRGGLILTLGLISLIGGWTCYLPVLLGPFAWMMGSNDLRAMRAGQMDPSGESTTRAGQVCGIISSVFLIIAVLIGGCVILAHFGRF